MRESAVHPLRCCDVLRRAFVKLAPWSEKHASAEEDDEICSPCRGHGRIQQLWTQDRDHQSERPDRPLLGISLERGTG